MNRPSFVSVSLADGLKWRAGNGWHVEEKMDGRYHIKELPHATVAGELMAGGQFIAFDVLRYDSQDVHALPLWQRLAILDGMNLPRPAVGSGGEFLAAVLERGGEGVIAKPLDSPFGVGWLKCKRRQVYYCRVIDLDQWRGSAILADSVTGEKRGKLPLRSRFERVKVGSVLKVEAFGLHKSGLLREARVDHDAPGSWLVSL